MVDAGGGRVPQGQGKVVTGQVFARWLVGFCLCWSCGVWGWGWGGVCVVCARAWPLLIPTLYTIFVAETGIESNSSGNGSDSGTFWR